MRHPSRIFVILLILVLAIGLYVRMDTLFAWEKAPEHTFFHGRPLPLESDGYYFLSLAREHLNGTRATTGIECSFPPPLLSLPAAGAARITGAPYRWAGTLMAPVIGVLAAFPVYLAGSWFGGPIAGLIASLVTLFAPFYSFRTNFAFPDTDGLIVTLATAACLFALRFGTTRSRVRYWQQAGTGKGPSHSSRPPSAQDLTRAVPFWNRRTWAGRRAWRPPGIGSGISFPQRTVRSTFSSISPSRGHRTPGTGPGTWRSGSDMGRHPEYMSFQGLREEGDEIFSNEGRRVNLTTGKGTAGGKAIGLGELVIRKDGRKVVRKKYGIQGSRLEILEPMRFGVVMDQRVAGSVFNMLMLGQEAPPRYFRPVALNAPISNSGKLSGMPRLYRLRP